MRVVLLCIYQKLLEEMICKWANVKHEDIYFCLKIHWLLLIIFSNINFEIIYILKSFIIKKNIWIITYRVLITNPELSNTRIQKYNSFSKYVLSNAGKNYIHCSFTVIKNEFNVFSSKLQICVNSKLLDRVTSFIFLR